MGSQRVGHDWVTEPNWNELREHVTLNSGGKKVKLFNLGRTRLLSGIFTRKSIRSLLFLNFCYHSQKIMVEGCFRIKSEHGPHAQHCSWLIFLFPDLPLFRLPETSHLERLSFFFFNLRLEDWVILRFPGTSFFVRLRLKTCIFKIFILFLAVLGLCFHLRSFSSYSQWGLLSSCSECMGFSLWWPLMLWSMGSRVWAQ